MKTPIDLHFGFAPPYACITSAWVEALAARRGRTARPVLHHPLEHA